MPRILTSLAALLLCSTALASCDTVSSVTSFNGEPKSSSDRAALEKQMRASPPSDVASGVRQAHELRLAGKYDDASRILSQLMLVASDDPRVVGEYGKTLLQRGRMQDAVQFLSRAVEIQSGDWTTYSALGVAYDQIGDQASAKNAYEHALALQPNDASVLSNYALSRMLASDMEGARLLAARAQRAGGATDPKIARNIAMIQAAAPQPQPLAMTPAPQPVASTAPATLARPVAEAAPASQPVAGVPQIQSKPVAIAPLPQPKPVASVAPAPQFKPVANATTVEKSAFVGLPAAPKPVNPAVAASGAPRTLTSASSLPAGTQPLSGVVMQRVPNDPLAGPVKAKPVVAKAAAKPVTHAPEAVAKTEAKPDAAKNAVAKTDSVKTEIAKTDVKPGAEKIATSGVTQKTKTAATTPVKPVGEKPEPVKAAAATPAAKPVAVADKAATPVKAATATPAKPVIDKSEPIKTVVVTPAKAIAAPVKTATATPVKPATDKLEPVKAAAVTPPAKVAAATPANKVQPADKTPAAVKAAAKQDGVPALRLAADASTP